MCIYHILILIGAIIWRSICDEQSNWNLSTEKLEKRNNLAVCPGCNLLFDWIKGTENRIAQKIKHIKAKHEDAYKFFKFSIYVAAKLNPLQTCNFDDLY